jgi:cell wall-associated NlpC family hydrolase
MKLFTALVTAFLVLVGAWASFGSTSKPATTQTYNLVEKLVELDKQRHLVQKRKHLVQVTKHLVRFADKTPYVFSGSTPSGWDCSGMVVWAYKQVGVTLPHSADKQAHQGKRVSNPQIGDLVVFAYSGSTNFYHSAIYLGEGKIINANLMYKTTKIQLLTDFKKSQIRFVRVGL